MQDRAQRQTQALTVTIVTTVAFVIMTPIRMGRMTPIILAFINEDECRTIHTSLMMRQCFE
jgi:hypothetical protein